MALIVVKIVPPAALAGQSNGQLNPAILADTPGLAGGPRIRLLADTATRAWRAMCAAAPMVLQATSSADSYRTYAQQVATFTDRYQVEPTTNGYRLWDSDGDGVRERWYKKDGVASAAVPGTSNHGWGLAVDVANASGARLDWLEVHVPAYGWSWELVPEEPWHIHYWAGDAIPQAVLDYEEAQLTNLDDKVVMADGTARSYAKLIEDTWNHLFCASYAHHTPEISKTSIQARVESLLARPPGSLNLTPEDRAAIVADLTEALSPLLAQVAAEARDAVADLGEGGAAQVRADA